MLSPAALGITPAQLYTRSKSPREVFIALDKDGSGKVPLEDARVALKSLGVHLNLTEARMLAQHIDGDRAPMNALSLDYNAFLTAAGATKTRGDIPVAPPAGPFAGASVPSNTRDVAAQLGARLVQERGVVGEGYKAMLAEAPVPLTKPYPGRKAQVDAYGGLNTFMSEECTVPVPRSIKNIYTTGEFTSAGIGAFLEDPSANAPRRKPDALQVGVLDHGGGIGQFVTQPAGMGETEGLPFPSKSTFAPHAVALGRIAESGSLTAFLDKDHSTALPPPLPKDTRHIVGGEMASEGIASFIATPADIKEGYFAHSGRESRRVFNDSLYTSSAATGLNSSRLVESAAEAAARGGSEVPILGPSDATDSDAALAASALSSLATALAPKPLKPGVMAQSAQGTRERTGTLSGMSAGLGGFIMTAERPAVPANAPISTEIAAAHQRGVLSASGGLGGFQTLPRPSGSTSSGSSSSSGGAPTGSPHHPDKRSSSAPPTTLDDVGGLGGFLTTPDYTLPPTLIRSLAMGHPPRSAVVNHAQVGHLTAAGGIGQYYEAGAAASAAASAAAAAAAAAHRQQHPHIQGRLEAGGLKEYLTTAPPLPQNHLYTINPAVPKETFVHHKVPVHSGNLGALDKVGGVSGFFNAPPTPGVDPVPSTRGVHQALHALSSLSLSTTAPGGFAPAPPSSLSASAGSAAPAPAKMSALEALASAAEADLDAEQPTGPPLGHKVVSPASSAPPPPQPAAHQTPSSKGARGLFLSHLEEGSPAVEPSTPAAISQAASALADLSLAHLQSTPSSAAKPAAADSSSGFDLRRLARVRKAIRDVLPKKGSSAAAVLRSRLSNQDGDCDGVVSDLELMRGLYTITPNLVPSDCAFLIKYLAHRFPSSSQMPKDVVPSGVSRGLTQGICASDAAAWFTAQPGGQPGKGGEEEEETPRYLEDRLGSSAQHFARFRASWEEKHGAAGRKEMAMDAAEKPEGPTWTRAEPTPFKVLRMVAGPPATPV